MDEYPTPDFDTVFDGEEGLTVWLAAVALLIAVVGLVGNGLILWLLGFRIRKNPISVYVLNLATAEALFLSSHSILCVGDAFDIFEHSPSWLGVNSITDLAYSVALGLRAAICTELCLWALYPCEYPRRRPQHTSGAACGGVWALASLLWGSQLIFCLGIEGSGLCLVTVVAEKAYLLLLTTLLFVASLALVLRVRCGVRRRRRPRLYRLALLTALVFLLCGLPPEVQHFLETFGLELLIPSWIPQLLANVNCSANPFLYFFLDRRFRQGRRGREPLRLVLQRVLEHGMEGEEREASQDTSWETSF